MSRIEREQKVVGRMIEVYCRRVHRQPTVCEDCHRLTVYAHERLSRCPKGEAKGSCRKCEIHCYEPRMRAAIREVMKTTGPSMLLIDPINAVRHLIDELK